MVELFHFSARNASPLTIFYFEVGKPEPIPLWMNVFQPFARPVWISVMVILPLRFIFLYTLGKMYPSKYFEARTLVQLLVALPLKQTSKRKVCLQ